MESPRSGWAYGEIPWEQLQREPPPPCGHLPHRWGEVKKAAPPYPSRGGAAIALDLDLDLDLHLGPGLVLISGISTLPNFPILF